MSTDIQQAVCQMFIRQTTQWDTAHHNYRALQNIKTRSFLLNGVHVNVQFNPARSRSTCAVTTNQAIADRPCFLCKNNRPQQQESIAWYDYEILVNPFPIFSEHFTIACSTHRPQAILPYITDMAVLAQQMEQWTIFYNGPQCGASAPDHLHFQAGTKYQMPLLKEYKHLKPNHAECYYRHKDYTIYRLNNYLRTIICIESRQIEALCAAFNIIYNHLPALPLEEPMMNVICNYEQGQWQLFIFPRQAFRPWQYSATPDQQLLISPATVEMGGLLITPSEEHFFRLNETDIRSIYSQVSLPL